MSVENMRVISITVNVMCFLVCLMLSILYYSKKKIVTSENRIYDYLLGCNIICLISEFVFYMISVENISGMLISIVEKLYFSFNVIWLLLLTTYIWIVSSIDKKICFKNWKIKEKKLLIISLIILSFMFVNVLPIENIYEGKYLVSSVGASSVFMFFSSFILIILDIIMVVVSRKNITVKKAAPLFVFIIIMSLELVANTFGLKLMLITLPMTFVSFLMYHTIENPDVKMIEQLEIARDQANKANAAKTDFLSSMSHEIRTPLNAIVGFSDCIKHSQSLEEAKENADDIINASNTLLEIVNGILDISKIEAGKLEIINSDYNAPKLFNGLAKLVTPKMNEKGLDFQISIAEDLPATLYGDSANVKKVVTNLLSNAYKYTDKGYVKFEVKCVNNDGICRLIISVEDSGRGIKKESIDKLFTKFQRVEEDKNTTIEGTGLGLAITKQLVELMGGSVVVTSVYGEGSKFIITLDQRIDNVVVEEKEVSDTIDLSNKKLLVVDDNMVNLKVATKLFEKYNAIVDVCDSGFKCIELIEAGNKYDLILMDIMMPKMNGTETLKKLLSDKAFNTPVVALTADAITGMREKYLSEGFTDYLAKPIEKDAMIKSFNNIFNDTSAKKSTKVVEEINFNRDFLEANGIDVNHGLELLGDISLYNETMGDFLTEIEKRLPLLAEYKEKSDMENYAIIVHAIKSDCKYLGIMSLADIAYEHELKSKEKDINYVNENYDSLINMIGDYVTICKNYLDRD